MSLPRLQFKAAIQLGWFKNPILIAPGHLWLWENQKPLLSGKPSPIKTEKILFSGRIWKLQIITDILPESSIPILRWALLQLRPKEWVGGDRKMNDFFFTALNRKYIHIWVFKLYFHHLNTEHLLYSKVLELLAVTKRSCFSCFLPFYVGGEIDKIKKKKNMEEQVFQTQRSSTSRQGQAPQGTGVFCASGAQRPRPCLSRLVHSHATAPWDKLLRQRCPSQLRATPSTNTSLPSSTDREQSPLGPSALTSAIWSTLSGQF